MSSKEDVKQSYFNENCIISFLRINIQEDVSLFKELQKEHKEICKQLMDIWLGAGGFLKCLSKGIFNDDEKIFIFLSDLKEVKKEYKLIDGELSTNSKNRLHDEFNKIILESLN